ncbi:MAG: TolC family protein [Kiritimatiellae bacterium]|nr:TolC family protein [Kiritimatiellia bacterium]
MMVAGNNLLTGVLARCFVCAAAMLWLVFLPVACMTPEKAVKDSDAAGVRLATECWQRQTGRTNDFDVHRPADALTLRIALLAVARGEQGVVFPELQHTDIKAVANGTLSLSLKDALCVAARNDRQYQTHKETVFLRALDLDYQQYQFENSFSGMMLGLLSGDPAVKRATGQASSGFERKLESGLKVAGALAFDVVSLLRDDWRSLGVTGDLTMSLPLLRGSGREIIREPLTQAERDLLYAIMNFEHYRQTYSVSVASAYLDVLEYVQRLENALDNERRLAENSRRAEMMFDAGRMQRIQVDQARSDLLTASQGVISTRKSYETKLDDFKMRIGLPPESKLELEPGELALLERLMENWANVKEHATETFPDELEAYRIALAERRDMIVMRHRVDDSVRSVKIAADDLRADATLTGSVGFDRARSTGQSSFSGGELSSLGLRASLPWDRRRERNAFKRQLVLLEQTKRALEEKEDSVKQSVRNGYRNLVAARASYLNQVESMKVAKLRVDSNDLFLQSGRSSMRDILEAEGAMLSARNALCSAVILWWRSDLELRRDLGVLDISDAGMWHDFYGDENGG